MQTMDDGRRRQGKCLVENFYEIKQSINRLGCRLRSDIETVDRLEANFLNQRKDLENLEQRLLFVEKNLRREETTVSAGKEEGQSLLTSGTGSSSSVENKEPTSLLSSDIETVDRLEANLLNQRKDLENLEQRLLFVEKNLRRDTERISKLNTELLERQAEWKSEKEELLQRQTQLEEQIRALQEQLSRPSAGKQRDAERNRRAAKGSVTWDILDKTLFRVVVQCFVALREASFRRRVESSCLLIQRIFRGYVVRKRIQLTTHRPKLIADSETIEEGSESVFISADACQSLAARAAPDLPTSIELTEDHHSSELTSTAAAAEEEDYDNNSKAKDGDGSGDVHWLGSDSNSRPKPRKGSLPKLLQPTKANRRSWSVSGTTEWQDPTDTVIHSFRELKQLELFFADKIAKLSESSAGKSSIYDVVFAEALQKFHSRLTDQLSSAKQEDDTNHGYKDLMNSFERVLKDTAQLQLESSNDFPHTLFVNAFRGFIAEFLKKKHNRELPNIKTKKDQQKTNKSKRQSIKSVVVGGELLPGAGLSQLASSERLVFVDRLTAAIESKGLSVVGLYRVAGNAVKIKQLIKDMTAAGASSSALDLGERNPHVMTSVLKTVFREMPQPLITLDLYEDFIQLPDKEDKSESLAIAINKLPELNRDLLNRLITHLAKVAQHESSNLMSANALAIVFAPCLLRPSDDQSVLLEKTMNQIQKQTACLQFIIESQLEKMKNGSDNLKPSDTDTIKAADIDTAILDDISFTGAETTASNITGNVDVAGNMISPARISDTDTTDNDAVSDIYSSSIENDPVVCDTDIFDSAAATVYDSAFANEADTATTSEGSVANSSFAEDEQKMEINDEGSLSTASEDLDLDFNVNICYEDGDDDLEVTVTSQPNDLNVSERSEVDDDVASSPAPRDGGHVNDVKDELPNSETTKTLKSSENASKDPPHHQENSSSERLANTLSSSASAVN